MKRFLIILLFISGFSANAQPVLVLDSLVNPLCGNSSDGEIYISVSGGITPYTYDWDSDGSGDFDDPEDLLNISGGQYICIVKDGLGFEDTIIVDLAAPPPISIQLISWGDECCDQPTAYIDAQASGGTGSYDFSIDNFVTNNSTGYFSSLFAGLYNVKVKDVNGCQDSTYAALSDFPSPVISLSADSTCYGANSADIYANIMFGCFPLVFDWDYDGVGDIDDPQNLLNVPPGTYTLHVYESNGLCSNSSATITVYEYNNALDIQTDTIVENSCVYDTSAFIETSIVSGFSPFTYDWSIDGFGDMDDSPSIYNLPNGSYTLVVTDSLGCTDTITQSISNFSDIDVQLAFSYDNVCEGDTSGQIIIDIFNYIGPLEYDWDIDGLGDFDDSPNIYYLPEGLYTVVVKDSLGCMDTLSVPISDGIALNATVSSYIDSLVADQTGTYQWVECPSYDVIPGATEQYYIGTQTGDYAVILTNGNGCKDTSLCVSVDFTTISQSKTISADIWPNPASNFLTIQIKQGESGMVNILDLNGKVILSSQIKNNATIDLENLSNGLYFVELIKDDFKLTKKLIIQH